MKGETSSQFFSALLIISPYAKEKVTISSIGNVVSRPYLDITMDIMKDFGVKVKHKEYKTFEIEPGSYKARDYQIEGDYTQAANFFAAAAILDGKMTVGNLKKDSKQGDIFFLRCLKLMGCYVEYGKGKITVEKKGRLKPIIADMNHYPDLVPILAVTAAFAKGHSEFTNIAHLKFKESNRLQAISAELNKMGIKTRIGDDSIIIKGGKPKGATISPHNDHRLAMAFAVAGLKAKGTIIENPECVNKSYPDFWKVFRTI